MRGCRRSRVSTTRLHPAPESRRTTRQEPDIKSGPVRADTWYRPDRTGQDVRFDPGSTVTREGPLLESLGSIDRTPLSGMNLGWWIALAAVAVASVIDWRSRRIPNLLTFPLVAFALLGNSVAGGGSGFLASLVGLAIGLVFFLLLMALGAMGPGDVKLMAALGALLGVVNVFWIGLFTAVMGGVLAVLYSLGQGSLPRMLHRTGTLLKHIVFTGHLPKAEELNATRGDYMPYALAIALGVTAQYLWRGGS